jgi:hypothetical protein
MIRIKDQNQGVLFDPWHFLSPKRRDLLDQSWAGLFQKELLCELPVDEVAASFKEDRGRPTKEPLYRTWSFTPSASARPDRR